jgi:hypothetical protein
VLGLRDPVSFRTVLLRYTPFIDIYSGHIVMFGICFAIR